MTKWVYFFLARIFQIFGRESKAVDAFNMSIQIDRDFFLAVACLAHLHASLGNKAESIRLFKESLRIRPHSGVIHFNLGFMLEAEKQYEEALSEFAEAVRLSPTIDRAWFGMGMCHAAMGRHEEASAAFEKSAELQPMNPHAWYCLGMAHHKMGNQEKVIEVIRQITTFDPKMSQKLIDDTGSPGSIR